MADVITCHHALAGYGTSTSHGTISFLISHSILKRVERGIRHSLFNVKVAMVFRSLKLLVILGLS